MSHTGFIYDSFYDASSAFGDFNRSFNAALDARLEEPSMPTATNDVASSDNMGMLIPSMDRHESIETNEVTATLELPGIKKEDVYIEIRGGNLVIFGETTVAQDLDKDGYAIRERRFGKFFREIPLPPEAQPEDVNASMENGILKVEFPKWISKQDLKKIEIH
ncbi:hypothetical protein M422DRAFT_71514 [Sphaerobolus stellatus SS14]|uniref:SHSP domain-containing protein n=1 Tax=Sphaerobolus stellatus (strain SS14) TaxID=990650 RepID=A0A0C9TF55_SPHS4|nr:hypothetical protein M422DRAFT_71514 [Sphaerobolus stellatus SS14]